jgi:uncharacterized delta-60 repeat protein
LTALIAISFSTGTSRGMQAAAGDLDITFGNDGKVVTDFFGNSDEASGVVVQPDGKIIAVGTAFNPVTSGDFAVARYNKNGSLDTTFGSGGKVTTNFSPFGSGDAASDVALQQNGKIVVGGSSTFGTSAFALVRYNGDGSLDSSFGAGGKVTTLFSGPVAAVRGTAIQPDGKIVAVGLVTFNFNFPPRPDFALARYNTDGSLDLTFGIGGRVTTNFNGLGDVANAVAIEGDGRIVLVGTRQVTLIAPELTQFAIARYNIDGSLDSTFGTGGKVRPFFFGQFDEAHAVASLPTGKIIVAGCASNYNLPSGTDFAMIRLNGDGSVDSNFGSNGRVVTDFSSEGDIAIGMALQLDGKIVLAGLKEKGRFGDLTDFAVARYNPDGSLDGSFGGGKVTTDFFGFSNEANAVVVQEDGRIVVAGRANTGVVGDFALARYNATSFGLCLQDASNGNLLQIDASTGDYLFTNCSGLTLGGTGVISSRGSIITLQQNGPDRRVLAKIDGSVNKGTASVQVFSRGTTFTITDRNTLNNTCSCGAH